MVREGLMRIGMGLVVLCALLACSGLTSSSDAQREELEKRTEAWLEHERQLAEEEARAAEEEAKRAAEEAKLRAEEEARAAASVAGQPTAPPVAATEPALLDDEGEGKEKVPFEKVDEVIRGSVAVRACFAEWERSNPAVSRVDVELTLTGRGKATGVAARGEHAGDKLGKCLVAAIEALTFPAGKKQRFVFPVARP